MGRRGRAGTASTLVVAVLLLWPAPALAQELPEQAEDPQAQEPEEAVPEAHFPVAEPHGFSDDFGAPRSGGRTHQGIDVFADKMTPVLAVADGVVEKVGWTLGGNYVTVRHDNGWTSVYIHLNNDTPGTDDGQGGSEHAFAPGVAPGVEVKAGDLLGWVGDSGNAEETPPHLHFEVRTPEGKAINPFQMLQATASAPVAASTFFQGEGTLPHTGVDASALARLGLLLISIGMPLVGGVRPRGRQGEGA